MNKVLGVPDTIQLRKGEGTISLIISMFLSVSCFLGVVAFHFPEYLTTPELRNIYSDTFARGLLFFGILFAIIFATIGTFSKQRGRLAGISFFFIFLTLALGGISVPVDHVESSKLYFGLDFLILNLLAFSLIFIPIEKFFGQRKNQLVFRSEWKTDLMYFVVNHILIGVFFMFVNSVISAFDFAVSESLQASIKSLHFVWQFLLTLLVADMAQYWLHRAYHEIPFLWKFHAIHHSVEEMDWLAGSRLHVVELLLTRSCVLLPIFLLGFDVHVVNAYITFVAFQAVYDHANVSVNPSFLHYIFVTPNFHHWHHSQEKEALDKNYAVHFSFLDYLFGTAVNSQKMWPTKYGVLGDYVPRGFLKQFAFPFVSNVKAVEKYVERKIE
jgi:sterol desaturase/sphingolipid hydroxylase (fatty acid hydroxylase superfamily)